MTEEGKHGFPLAVAQRTHGLSTAREGKSLRSGFPPNVRYLLGCCPRLMASQGTGNGAKEQPGDTGCVDWRVPLQANHEGKYEEGV